MAREKEVERVIRKAEQVWKGTTLSPVGSSGADDVRIQ